MRSLAPLSEGEFFRIRARAYSDSGPVKSYVRPAMLR